jgi:hypothetical protein
MTIPANENSITTHIGNGVADTFDYEFKITNEADLAVLETGTNNVDTILVLNVDYTVAGVGNDGGGSIKLLDGPLTDQHKLTIQDNVEVSQTTPYGNQSSFFGNLHENSFDKLTRLARRTADYFNLTLRLSAKDIGSASTLLPSPSAGDLFQWNEDATAIKGVTINELATTVAFSNFKSDRFVDGIDYTAGTTTQLVLSESPGILENTHVHFDGVYQEKVTYTLGIDGVTITFDSPIPLGTGAVEVGYGTAAPEGSNAGNDIRYDRVFATVADMKAERLSVGQSVKTQGYHTAGDGGGATYLVATGQAVDGYGDHTLANGNVALLQEVSPSSLQYGCVGDGVTDNLLALEAVDSSSQDSLFVPEGEFITSALSTTLTKRYFGDGHITAAGQDRGRTFVHVEEEKTISDDSSWTTRFNGDTSSSPNQIDVQYEATVSNPFGAPGSTYVYRNEITPNFTQLRIGADVGFNSTLDQNGPGRSGATAYRTHISHSGQGDAVCFSAGAFVDSQKAGATHWLAQPAIVLYNGNMSAGADYTYLNCTEFSLSSGANDCAGIGAVYNLRRDVARVAQETYWSGIRIQSQGAEEVDTGLSLTGKAKIGIDLSSQQGEAALALAADNRVYYDAQGVGGSSFDVALGNTYTVYDGSKFNFNINGYTTCWITDGYLFMNGGQIQLGTTSLINFSSSETSATASAGAATLPDNPVGFVNVKVGGTDYRMPYYNV